MQKMAFVTNGLIADSFGILTLLQVLIAENFRILALIQALIADNFGIF